MDPDYERRVVGLQKKMEEANLDLVVYGSCQNFQYLTGILIDWRRGIDLGNEANNVFVPQTGAPVLTLAEEYSSQAVKTWMKDIRVLEKEEAYNELVRQIVSDLNLKENRIGIGDHVWGSTVTEIAKTIKHTDFYKAESLMDSLRMLKDQEEIERLRKVAKLTDQAVEAMLPKIKKGVTQRELELEVEFQGKQLGASDVSFPPTVGFVKSGSEVSANPFTYPKDKGLVSDTSFALDIGFVMDGYCSDFGRSFYFGTANAEVKKGYEALHAGVLETVDKMRDGSLRACDVYPELEKTLDRLGYGDYLRARLTTKNLGHNIGIEVHEPPWLSPAYTEMIREGMIMALEPKVWHAGQYYLRVEDIVHVKSQRTEFLTNFDRELFQL